MNETLGNIGSTVIHTPPVEAEPVNQTESLRELVVDMASGEVDTLIILGGNPVYTAPVDFDFTEHLDRVDFRVHLGQYVDETSYLCHWHIPQTHSLETWSDARGFDGTATIMQPLIAPLYGSRSDHEVLAALLLQPDRSSYDSVRAYWENQYLGDDFERFWQISLHNGVVPGTALPATDVALVGDFAAQLPASPVRPATGPGMEIFFRPDPAVWDGSFANNGWLQELPKPLSKITWGNAALISPRTAERLDLTNEDVVELIYRGRSVRAPVWILPGHADESVTVSLGYGRARVGPVGEGVGFNAYMLRTSDAPWHGSGLEVRKTGEQFPIATTQNHFTMEGRNLVYAAPVQVFRDNPSFIEEIEHPPPSLYPEFEYDGYAWGMAIDINTCIGCNACVVACQAENNIPLVGKEGVIQGREMHWLKLDEYFEFNGDLDNPTTFFQPRPCMHCEKAPCEVVCPVAATVHSSEGLNDMIYNRCVGTRYCSNNCPYKVRRFNFFQYAERDIPVIELMRNPDVTVRTRGVMEKCTYCVQRINSARIEAQKENRPIRDGEVLTACQEACPTRAIIFGDISDPNTQVARLKVQPHNYGLLAELGTQPRTTYLARFSNPNPEIAPISQAEVE